VDYESFLTIVEQQTDVGQPGIGRDEAQAATWAVLETLAERIDPDRVDDLIARLPTELHDPLQRGKAHPTNRLPGSLPVEDFLGRVGEREGIDRDRAASHTEAVFAALRETTDESVFGDLE